MSASPHTSGPSRPPHARSLDRFPNVYDAAFSWDRRREACTFLRAAAARRGRSVRTAVELACGSGTLARLWGSWGLQVYGVDRSPSAIAWARQRAHGLVPSDHWILADLQGFRLPLRVELAVVPMDGLGYLVEADELLRFFRSVRRALVPGGVLGIDLTVYPEGAPAAAIRNSWSVRLRPRGRLGVRWRSHGRATGSPRRRWESGEVIVHLPGRPDRTYWTADPHATLGVRTLRELAERAGGWGPMWGYSDAAHRAESRRLRRSTPRDDWSGPRLMGWDRV